MDKVSISAIQCMVVKCSFQVKKKNIYIYIYIIIYTQKSEKLYSGKTACDMIGAPGERIKKPKLEKYRVFVQSKGIGFRPLACDSLVLYEVIQRTHLSQ